MLCSLASMISLIWNNRMQKVTRQIDKQNLEDVLK